MSSFVGYDGKSINFEEDSEVEEYIATDKAAAKNIAAYHLLVPVMLDDLRVGKELNQWQEDVLYNPKAVKNRESTIPNDEFFEIKSKYCFSDNGYLNYYYEKFQKRLLGSVKNLIKGPLENQMEQALSELNIQRGKFDSALLLDSQLIVQNVIQSNHQLVQNYQNTIAKIKQRDKDFIRTKYYLISIPPIYISLLIWGVLIVGYWIINIDFKRMSWGWDIYVMMGISVGPLAVLLLLLLLIPVLKSLFFLIERAIKFRNKLKKDNRLKMASVSSRYTFNTMQEWDTLIEYQIKLTEALLAEIEESVDKQWEKLPEGQAKIILAQQVQEANAAYLSNLNKVQDCNKKASEQGGFAKIHDWWESKHTEIGYLAIRKRLVGFSDKKITMYSLGLVFVIVAALLTASVRVYNIAHLSQYVPYKPVMVLEQQGESARTTSGITYSLDGQYIFSNDGSKVWSIATGKMESKRKSNLSSSAENLIYSPDREVLAGISKDWTAVNFWDRKTGQQKEASLQYGKDKRVNSIAYSQDGQLLAVGLLTTAKEDNSKNAIRSIDIEIRTTAGWTKVKSISLQGDYTLNSTRYPIFSPDLAYAAVLDKNGVLRVYSMDSGQEVRSISTQKADFPSKKIELEVVMFSPDGRFLICRNMVPEYVAIFDVATGTIVHEIFGEKELSNGIYLVYSPNGRYLAVKSYTGIRKKFEWRNSYCKVDIWDMTNLTIIKTLEDWDSPSWLGLLAFSPDSRYLASSWGDKVTIWDIKE